MPLYRYHKRLHLALSVNSLKRHVLNTECYSICWKTWIVRDHLGDLGVDGRIIVNWILKKWDVRLWTGFIWRRTGPS